MNFDFSVFVLNDGSVLKVGSICFVDSHSSPFIISRIFKSSLGGTAFVCGVRCHCEGGKVISVLQNFQVTVDCSFVRPCRSAEFCLSIVSSEVCNFVFHGQTSVFISRKKFWKCSISERANFLPLLCWLLLFNCKSTNCLVEWYRLGVAHVGPPIKVEDDTLGTGDRTADRFPATAGE